MTQYRQAINKTQKSRIQRNTEAIQPVAAVQRSLTFQRLCVLEPRLLTLYKRARALHGVLNRTGQFCANSAFYGYGRYFGKGLKQELLALVGWERTDKHPILGTNDAYELSLRKIYYALPDCVGCRCTSSTLQFRVPNTVVKRGDAQ